MSDNAKAGSNSEAGTDIVKVSETRLFADILKQPVQLAASLSHMLGPGKPALNAAADVLREARSVVITGIVVARYAQDLGIDEPLAQLRSSTTSYYEADGLGSRH